LDGKEALWKWRFDRVIWLVMKYPEQVLCHNIRVLSRRGWNSDLQPPFTYDAASRINQPHPQYNRSGLRRFGNDAATLKTDRFARMDKRSGEPKLQCVSAIVRSETYSSICGQVGAFTGTQRTAGQEDNKKRCYFHLAASVQLLALKEIPQEKLIVMRKKSIALHFTNNPILSIFLISSS
jgi:hypothetical protein